MKIVKMNESWAKIALEKDRRKAWELLSCELKNKWYVPAYRNGHWDGVYRFCNIRTGVFPLGLASLLPRPDIIEVKETKPIRYRKDIDLAKMKLGGDIFLRDYQIEAVQAAVENQRGILYMATGAGKTEVMAGIIRAVPKKKVCVLTHRKELLDQTALRLQDRLKIVVGKLGGGSDIMDEDVTVAMVQTITKRIKTSKMQKFLKSIDILLLDECHHASSDSWYKAALAMINARMRIGLSGTPCHKDEVSFYRLLGASGKIIYTKRNIDLMKAGYLSDLKVEVLEYECDELSFSTYANIYKFGITANKARNRLIVKEALKEAVMGKRKVLIVVQRISHGKNLQRSFQDIAGYDIDFTSGEKNHDYRAAVLEDFKKGYTKANILISSTILDEGIDVPDLDCVILAAAGKAPIALLQRIGRGLRKAEGKDGLKVIDFYDIGKYLEKHSKERLKVYKKESFPIERRMCDV